MNIEETIINMILSEPAERKRIKTAVQEGVARTIEDIDWQHIGERVESDIVEDVARAIKEHLEDSEDVSDAINKVICRNMTMFLNKTLKKLEIVDK